MQALLSFTSEARFLRYANKHLRQMFPVLPGQSGYNKRLRKLAHTMAWLIGVLATQVSVVTDQVWLVDSTPVECGRSRETVKRSDLRGCAEYGYCAAHTRYFWGFRLHLIATVHGIPIAWALTGAKADEREVLDAMLDQLLLELAPHYHTAPPKLRPGSCSAGWRTWISNNRNGCRTPPPGACIPPVPNGSGAGSPGVTAPPAAPQHAAGRTEPADGPPPVR